MAEKISELIPKGATIGLTDLIEISESDGLGGFVTKSVTGQNVAGLFNNQRLQVNAVTLAVGSWALVSGLYEFVYSNAAIKSTSVVDVTPSNSTIAIVQAAGILPSTDSSNGSVKIFANNLPTANIVVTFNIFN